MTLLRHQRPLAILFAALAMNALALGPAQAASDTPILPPRLLRDAVPQRPVGSEAASGEVHLRLLVGSDGKVKEAVVEQASVPSGLGLEDAAAAAARSLLFAPATHEGQPVPVVVGYTVRFEPPRVETQGPPAPAGAEPSSSAAAQPLVATVEGERDFTAASARTIRDRDLSLRPLSAPEDILRVVPGLVLAQHQGGGKADQLFLRGFDADHGTDVAVSLDGIGVNMPSHAHGQGYADLHFLIPEAIERIDATKGPYFADEGDFATAGAVDLRTRDRFEKSEVKVSGGLMPTVIERPAGSPGPLRGGSYRVLGIGAANSDRTRSWFAAEAAGAEGPFLRSEDLHRFNLFAKSTTDLSPSLQFSALATAYASGWVGSGQIPARLVDSGALDRFGAIDPTEGGDTTREQLIVSLRSRLEAQSQLQMSASVLRYGLTLFNDFTFQKRDPTAGDEIEQDDARTVLQASLRYDRRQGLGSFGRTVHTLGAQIRSDDIAQSLWHVHERARLGTCFDAANANPCVSTATRETDLALFAQEDLRPVPWARLVLGMRSDLFTFDVHSLRPDGSLDVDHPGAAAPSIQRTALGPKASLVLMPLSDLDLFFNFGRGFHSNDARGVIESGGAGALAQATGYEVGARARLLNNRLALGGALWRLDLSSELTWNGDEGGTSPNDATRRQGVELEGRYDLLPWLYADLDISLTHAQFKQDSGNGSAVALAPPRIITGGLTAHRDDGWSASLRLRHIGPRPGTQVGQDDPADAANPSGPRAQPCTPANGPDDRCTLTAQGYTILDASAGYDAGRWALQLFAQNLTNSDFREAQFGNTTQVVQRPRSGAGASFTPETHPVQDLHYTPGNPLELQLAATLRF